MIRLTLRETAVLRLIAGGYSAKQVAQKLAIAPRTVEHHIDHARSKTKTRNRVHLVAYALHKGLLAPRGEEALTWLDGLRAPSGRGEGRSTTG